MSSIININKYLTFGHLFRAIPSILELLGL